MKGGLRILWLLAFMALSSLAHAHEMSMAEMELRETAPGEFTWQWTATKGGSTEDLKPIWPEACEIESANVIECKEGGLHGTLAMEGVGKRYSAALVKVHWIDGQSRVYTLTSTQPTVQLYGSADDRRGMGEIASAYTMLGVEHILSGIDHLLFVMGLLFLVGFNKRLVATVTAFTLAHSLTLALSALNLLTLRQPPVEAAIALSIVLVAAEALHHRETLSRRWPALVAFLFGLVHGLGFAGALKEIGLPENHLAVALGTFNVGVEIGQLTVVAASWGAWRMLSRFKPFTAGRRPALYAIGSVAACWTIGRVIGMVS